MPTIRWGAQTALAIENFKVSGQRMPISIIHALVMIKRDAALVNHDLGVIDRELAAAIQIACDEVLSGEMDDQFPVDVFQTGSGTSTNMNVNEVVAQRATEILGRSVHPNDHVNASQSSNDVVPSAIRLAIAILIVGDVLLALGDLGQRLRALAARHHDTIKLGRTHLMDAVPMTFGQEVGGWASMVDHAAASLHAVLPRLGELPMGGTAIGTGLNAPDGFGTNLAARLSQRTGLAIVEAPDHFEAQSTMAAVGDATAASRQAGLSLFKIAGDLRLLSSGPRGGLGELTLPARQAGSSIMPGKVNPIIPEVMQQVAAQLVGHDATVAFAASLATLQMSTAMPLVGHVAVASMQLLGAGARSLAEQCIDEIVVNTGHMRHLAIRSTALATVLVPTIGYDRAHRVADRMLADDLPLEEAAAVEGVGALHPFDYLKLAHGEPG